MSWSGDKVSADIRTREDFIITRHPSEGAVLRSFCQLYESRMVRDVVTAVDLNFQPTDASVRVIVDGELQGTAWYTFGRDTIECEAVTDKGRISQTESLAGTFPGIGTHALQGDAWLLANMDFASGPAVRTLEKMPFCSTHLIGATGPHLEFVTADVEYFGDEEVETEAGVFVCRHVAWVSTSNDHPRYDMWVSTDGDYLLVKGYIGGDWDVSYELVQHEEE